MRKFILLAALALGVFTAGTFNAQRAEAMAIGTPMGIATAAEGTNLVQDAAYVCRRAWRCGPYGCGWRRACWWTGPRYYYGGYYGGWRHRHWRHHHHRW